MNNTAIALGFAIVSFGLGAATDAHGMFRRFPGQNCQLELFQSMSDPLAWTVDQTGVRNDSSSYRRNVFCPVVDESGFRNSSITSGAVDIFNSGYTESDGTSTVLAVCRHSNVSDSYSCSSFANAPGNYTQTIWLNSSAINLLQDSNKVDWYSTMWVGLAHVSWNLSSQIRGYGYFNPN